MRSIKAFLENSFIGRFSIDNSQLPRMGTHNLETLQKYVLWSPLKKYHIIW